MKLAEFRSLCQREWDEHRGDIVTLWLTEDSYRELSEESLMAGAQDQKVLSVVSGYDDPSHAAWNTWTRTSVSLPRITTVRNPVTKNEVRMKLARDRDAADVFSGKDKVILTRIL